MTYPHVLIIGEQFDQFRGAGITLSNLFSGWPRDCLSVTSYYAPTPDTMQRASSYYLLGREELIWPWPLSRFVRQPISSPITDLDRTPLHASIPSDRSAPSRKGLLYTKIQEILGMDGLLPYARISPQFLCWISTRQPDVIYAQVSSLQAIRFVTRVTKITGLPLVLHQMDDWLPMSYGIGLLGYWSRSQADRLFGVLSSIAIVRMGICSVMAEDYGHRYGTGWKAFHNPIDLDRFKAAAKTNWIAGKPFRLWYGGRIGWGNQEGLAEACRAVVELRQEGFDICLEICTSAIGNTTLSKFAHIDGIEIKPFIPHEKIAEMLNKPDVLFLPLDWDKHSIARARLSIPTKTSEFMASGTTILVYAPHGNALTQYALEKEWAYVVSEHSLSALKAAIVKLAEDGNLRECIGRRAMEVASRNHDAKKIREAFQQAFIEAINQHSDFKSKSAGHQ